MNQDVFFKNFDLLADAPNGVQKLRELILQLAVMGNLVPQDPNNEPALVLLEKIKTEKKRLTKEKKLKKEESLPSIESKDVPFEIPKTWKWVYLRDDGQIVGGGTPTTSQPDYFSEEGVVWLTPADLYNLKEKFVVKGRRDLSELGLQKSSAQLMPAGTVLFSSRAPIGYVAIAATDLATNQGFKSCVPFIMDMNEFIYYFLKYAGKKIDQNASGTTFKEVSGKEMNQVLFPLPPLAEQKRIVSKVDELMALCDKLEARRQKKQEIQSKLNRAALDGMLSAENQEDFEQHWQRICENFDLLYDNPENVEKLRKAILQLAVQGKLVPQNPEDEPASVLIEKILKGKNIQKKQTEVNLSDIVYKLPNNWEWVRFGDVTVCRDNERIPVSRSDRENRKGIYDYYGASGVIDKIDNYLFDKSLLLIGEDGANLLNRSTPIAFIAEGKYWVNNHAHVIDGISLDFLRYLEIYINSIDLSPYVTGSAQPKMNQAKMNSIPIAIPPLAEQKSIVEKVEQFMGLCDELESKLRKSREDGEKLMEAGVKGLLEGAAA